MADYNLFVSYKSENADVARAVSEALTADGLRIWFAEYEIRLDAFDDIQAIQDAIDQGIGCASAGLIFTNDRWATSPFCERELVLLEERFTADDLLEVCIPQEPLSRSKYHIVRQIAACGHSMVYSNDVNAVVDFVRAHLAFLPFTNTSHKSATTSGELSALRYGVRVNNGDLSERRLYVRDSGRVFPGETYFFQGESSGHTVRMIVTVNPFATASRQAAFSAGLSASDRQIYQAFRRYAAWWFSVTRFCEQGLHLTFWQSRSHLGLTCRTPPMFGGRMAWERRYAINLATRDRSEMGEAMIAFHVEFDEEDAAAGFRKFCACAPGFDQIVQNLQYEPEESMAKEVMLLRRWKVATVAPLLVVSACTTALAPNALARNLAAAFGAFLLVEVTSCLISLPAARGFLAFSLWLKQQMTDLAMPSYERHPLEVAVPNRAIVQFNNSYVFAGALWAVWVAFVGLTNDVVSILAVATGVAFCVHVSWYWAVVGAVVGIGGIWAQITRRLKSGHPYVRAAIPIDGLPVMRLDGSLTSIAPEVIPILGDQRMRDRHRCASGWRVCIATGVLTAISTAAWGTGAGLIVGLAGLLVAGGIVWGRQRHRKLLEISGQPTKFWQQPSAASARLIAQRFREASHARDMFALSRAVQWAAYSCELSPNDLQCQQELAKCLTDLAETILRGIVLWSHEEVIACCRAGNQVIQHLVRHVPRGTAEYDLTQQLGARHAQLCGSLLTDDGLQFGKD